VFALRDADSIGHGARARHFIMAGHGRHIE